MSGDGVRKIALASDGSAFQARAFLGNWLETQGYRVLELGNLKSDGVDETLEACRRVASGDCERAIVLDATGIGPCIAANKVSGIRAAACWDLRTALDSRERDNANVLALGAAMHGVDELCAIIRAWLSARFDAPRHAARVNRISSIGRGG